MNKEQEQEIHLYDESCAICENRENIELCWESYLGGKCRYWEVRECLENEVWAELGIRGKRKNLK